MQCLQAVLRQVPAQEENEESPDTPKGSCGTAPVQHRRLCAPNVAMGLPTQSRIHLPVGVSEQLCPSLSSGLQSLLKCVGCSPFTAAPGERAWNWYTAGNSSGSVVLLQWLPVPVHPSDELCQQLMHVPPLWQGGLHGLWTRPHTNLKQTELAKEMLSLAGPGCTKIFRQHENSAQDRTVHHWLGTFALRHCPRCKFGLNHEVRLSTAPAVGPGGVFWCCPLRRRCCGICNGRWAGVAAGLPLAAAPAASSVGGLQLRLCRCRHLGSKLLLTTCQVGRCSSNLMCCLLRYGYPCVRILLEATHSWCAAGRTPKTG